MLPRAIPVVWVLQGPRAGDNAQAHELASLLTARTLAKELRFNPLHLLPNLVLGASAISLRGRSRKALRPPWPDLVIAIGKRSAPVARWIKRRSRGATRIVQLGRARAPLSAFDLVITTPQYGLPPASNVIGIPLPFASPKILEPDELVFWRKRWTGLRRPLIAVAVGNAKFPLRLGRREARSLGRQLNLLAEQTRGSLLLIASPRSAPRVIAQIERELSVPHRAYREFDPRQNSYPAALALCDRFVATSDSISMISELIGTGKPVDVFELPEYALKLKWRASSGASAWLARNGLLQPPRDVAGMVRVLIENGQVNALGAQRAQTPFVRQDAAVLERLRLLLAV